jgi:DNA invertase Pin-like site-specific DNA recombinase
MPSAAARIIGYARVSTDDQTSEVQEDELRAAGCCAVIYREQASGASKAPRN